MATQELHYDWSWSLPATPEELWPLVSNTDRFNRDTGLPALERPAQPGAAPANARRLLRLRVLGLVLEWEELPFEWSRPSRFGVVRRYSRGFLEEMRVLGTLEPQGDVGTRLRYQVWARPRGLTGALAARVQIGMISRRTFGRVFRLYAEAVRSGVPAALPIQAPRRAPPQAPTLIERLERAGVGSALARRLVDHVCLSDDMSVARIRPYALAGDWSLPRRDVLRACLEGTRSGLLDLSWDVLCPQCRGVRRRADTLRNLKTTGEVHCESCMVDFSPDFDQWVELSFRPSAAIRVVHQEPFCVAGPQVTPHVQAQQLLAPGESRELAPWLEAGRHGVRAIGMPVGPALDVEEGGAGEAVLTLEPSGWTCTHGVLGRAPRLRIVNRTGAERLVAIERTAWADDTVTAAAVTAMPEFRDLFASEVLAAGEFMSVGSLAVLFTDLKDSTRLYRRVGDAPAFGRVVRHFDVLKEAVERESGTIVKTIGDAVMAVFRRPEDGVRAVLSAQRTLRRASEPLTLKAGLHYGPCIVVTLNDRLDYFGTTVNVAARLGGLSRGDDLVLSEGVYADEGVRALLAGEGATAEAVVAELRGIDGRVDVWRISARAAAPD